MQKIKGRIVEIFGSQKEFSRFLGVSENTISNKLLNKRNLTQTEILEWASALKIPKDKIVEYFF